MHLWQQIRVRLEGQRLCTGYLHSEHLADLFRVTDIYLIYRTEQNWAAWQQWDLPIGSSMSWARIYHCHRSQFQSGKDQQRIVSENQPSMGRWIFWHHRWLRSAWSELHYAEPATETAGRFQTLCASVLQGGGWCSAALHLSSCHILTSSLSWMCIGHCCSQPITGGCMKCYDEAHETKTPNCCHLGEIL